MDENKLLFGTAGIPHSSRAATTIAGIERVAELALNCIEIEFVHGVRMDQKTAGYVAEVANRNKVTLSAHCPYYINLNAREPDKLKASQERILQTARIGRICHATSIVFHAAFYMGDEPSNVYMNVKRRLQQIMEQLRAEKNDITVRVELMGKGSQFGTLEEVLALSSDIEGVAPCLDFAHLHARTGGHNSYEEFAKVLQTVENTLGRKALDDMHVHISGIEYGSKGERKHLNFTESDFKYLDFVRTLFDYNIRGIVIIESPNLEEDALLLQQVYRKITGN